MHDSCSIASSDRTEFAVAAITRYVAAPSFPCVGARSAFNRGRARFGMYGSLGDSSDVTAICSDLARFSKEFPKPGSDPATFIAIFRDEFSSESEFARRMWQQLQDMHSHDVNAFAWDPTVSSDPAESNFSFSVAGRAFFVVGLSPAASRVSRRAPYPCLVFNFHDQFKNLRANGKYEGLQKVVRLRDINLQGSINPVLARFGDASEARQYSGVAVDQSWKCPFHHLATASD